MENNSVAFKLSFLTYGFLNDVCGDILLDIKNKEMLNESEIASFREHGYDYALLFHRFFDKVDGGKYSTYFVASLKDVEKYQAELTNGMRIIQLLTVPFSERENDEMPAIAAISINPETGESHNDTCGVQVYEVLETGEMYKYNYTQSVRYMLNHTDSLGNIYKALCEMNREGVFEQFEKENPYDDAFSVLAL